MTELEKIYEETHPKIFAFFLARTMNYTLSEDLTQDVFYAALKGVKTFRGRASVQTWLFAIARNLLKKHYRSKKYGRNLVNKLSNDIQEKTVSSEELYLSKEMNWAFIEQVSKLDALPAEIVTLRVYGELSFKEIGDLIRKSENYVRVNFHRTKLKLQKEMRSNDE